MIKQGRFSVDDFGEDSGPYWSDFYRVVTKILIVLRSQGVKMDFGYLLLKLFVRTPLTL